MFSKQARIEMALAALLAGALALPGLAAARGDGDWGGGRDAPRDERAWRHDRDRRDYGRRDYGRRDYDRRGWHRDHRDWDREPHHRGHAYGRGYEARRDPVASERPVYRGPYIPAIPVPSFPRAPGGAVILQQTW